jgi:hypothetical protein
MFLIKQVKQFVEDYRAVNPNHQQLENRTLIRQRNSETTQTRYKD